MNLARQDSIITEIMEILSGAEALGSEYVVREMARSQLRSFKRIQKRENVSIATNTDYKDGRVVAIAEPMIDTQHRADRIGQYSSADFR